MNDEDDVAAIKHLPIAYLIGQVLAITWQDILQKSDIQKRSHS